MNHWMWPLSLVGAKWQAFAGHEMARVAHRDFPDAVLTDALPPGSVRITFDWVELWIATPVAAAENSTRVLPSRSMHRAAGSHSRLYLVQTP